MKIGMLVDVYKPHISGITNHISLIKKHLETAGHEVFVFTFGGQDYVDDEPNIIRSPGIPIIDTGYYLSIRYSDEAKQILKTMDIVHVHHPFVSGQLALRFCQPRGIPVVFTNHTRYDLYAKAYFPSLPDAVGDTFLKAYLPNYCESIDCVIAPSKGIKDVLEGFGVTADIIILPNGVDILPFKQSFDQVSRADLNIGNDDDLLLIFVGRLGPEKNLPFLIRSFNGALQAYPNVKLLLIGDGPEMEHLQYLVSQMDIAENVYFLGEIPYSDIPKYLKLADAFVTPSVTEVHPLSVIEALAAGLPVLGIQSPGIGDTIIDGYNGYLVNEEDLAAFTAKLIRMVIDKKSMQLMKENAALSAEQYAIEKTTENLAEIYKLVFESNHRKKSKWQDWFSQFRDMMSKQ